VSTPARGERARGRLAWQIVFAAAMGWLEAVVVVYIRVLLRFPMGGEPPTPTEMMRQLDTVPWLVPTEQGREAATIVMLASVAWLAGRSIRSRFGAFLVCFGVWDIVYYLGLHTLIHWPASLADRDLLFLIPPGPWWNQPVWVPIAISCAMIAFGIWLQRARGVAR
jgi:hypothetical protein